MLNIGSDNWSIPTFKATLFKVTLQMSCRSNGQYVTVHCDFLVHFLTFVFIFSG